MISLLSQRKKILSFCKTFCKKISFAKGMILATIVASIGIVISLASVWSFPDTTFPLGKGEKTKIDTDIRQIFVASRNGLSDIRVLFGASDTSGGGILRLALSEDSCDAPPIRIVEKEITDLASDDTESFRFDRLADSAGKRFCFTLSFEKGKGSKKATVFVRPNEFPHQSPALSTDQRIWNEKYSIAFRPAYRNDTISADLDELFDRMSQYKPAFLKGGFLLMITLLSLLLSFGFFFLSLFLIDRDRR